MQHTVTKDVFNFRLGTTSYILEADLLLNCEYLAPRVDDIELVLFESDEISNLPDPAALEQLNRLQAEHHVTYTVHLPLDIELGHPAEQERQRSIDKCRRVLERMSCLDPFAYIVHFHGTRRGKSPAENMEAWLQALSRSARSLASSGIDPALLCVETLDYPFEYVAPMVTEHGLSVCLDAGHLAFYDYPLEDYLDRYLSQSRVIHLHGHRDGMDHKDIGALPQDFFDALMARLSGKDEPRRVLTLEVFGSEDFERSLERMRSLCLQKK